MQYRTKKIKHMQNKPKIKNQKQDKNVKQKIKNMT